MIKRLIIAGMGALGQSLVHHLQIHYEIIAIDSCFDVVQDLLKKYDIQGIAGSVLDLVLLSQLDLDETCGFISVTEKDSVNLTACRYVRQSFSLGFIAARLKDLEIYTVMQTSALQEGIHLLLNLDMDGAKGVLQRLYYPNIMRHMSFFEKKLHGIVMKIEAKHHLCGMKIEDIERYHAVQDSKIIQIFRQNKSEVPHKNIVLKENDRVCIVYHPIVPLKRLFEISMNFPKYIVSLGINSFSYALAKIVHKNYFDLKQVFFVSSDPEKYRALAALYPEFSFYNGNPLDEKFREDLGIPPKESGILALGLSDADNLLSVLTHQHAHHSVSIVQDASYIPIGLKIGVRSIIHPNALILEQLMTHLSPSCVQRVHVLADTHSESTEPMVLITAVLAEESYFLKMQNSDFKNLDVQIIAVLRKKKLLFNPEHFIQNDQVLFLCSQLKYSQILDLLKNKKF
ncbi:NAD-binding protein [Holospora undulata]|uniref:RCK N-terminal domain-containing protein n=1 Tax=Holospora undulata HU1 TaxID=1321371 RepID=A0A061JHD0_9PROT|nr:NAD-binding protein [Holospora undulata]ETZ04663.1 hypothetical protein K737_300920 [Holospora undulata HU1]